MKIPCPACGRPVTIDTAGSDATLTCPTCRAKITESGVTDKTVLRPDERGTQKVLHLFGGVSILLAAVSIPWVLGAFDSAMWLIPVALLAFATLSYIAEQLLLIKAYLRAKADDR